MRGFLTSFTKHSDEKGVTAILVAIMLVMFLGFAALAIDIGYGYLTKNQLQDTADAAALAAANLLGNQYDICKANHVPLDSCTVDVAAIIDRAQEVANKSTVADQNNASANKFSIKSGEVMIGRWDPALTPDHFSTTDTRKPNAVRVITRRDSNANGPITTFFARVAGNETMNVSTIATAALTGQSESPLGGLPIPVGISCDWVQRAACGDTITFYPTGTSCAGWNTYKDFPANASKLGNILDGGNSNSSPNLTNCALLGTSNPSCYQSPETIAMSTQFVFIGGTLASAFPDMENLFNAMRVLNDGTLDQDTSTATWTTAVPIYGNLDGTCTPCGAGQSNPSGQQLIVGFATITMTEVTGSSSKELHGQLVCDALQPGRGGGGNYGTLGDISGLVQ